MLSVVPILALALVLQADAPAPAAAPAPAPNDAAISTAEPTAADDPIGALMQQQELAAPVMAPAPAAAVPVPTAPVATAPVTPVPPPAAAAPSTANVVAIPAPASVQAATPAQTMDEDEDEDAAEANAGLPSGPRPYASLPSTTPSVRPNAALFNNPMVRLPPAPAGSLDGGWVLTRSDGRKLYSFQFNDTGGGEEIEGAWRDLDREWSTLGSGPVTSVGYEGSGVTIRFFEKGRTDMSVILLTRAASGDWTGEFQSKNGPTQVVMRRN